jgi:hypothetical protein
LFTGSLFFYPSKAIDYITQLLKLRTPTPASQLPPIMRLPLLRIAILECDTPLTATRAKYGDYGGVFKALLSAGADALNHPNLSSKYGLSLTNWEVVEAQEYPQLDEIDAILITGSRYKLFR